MGCCGSKIAPENEEEENGGTELDDVSKKQEKAPVTAIVWDT
jgi:hypothetical protein